MVRKVDIAVAFIFGILIAVPLSLQFVGAWTGTQNTLSDGYMEVANVNATNYYFGAGDANLTAWVEGQNNYPWDYFIEADGSTYNAYDNKGVLTFTGNDAENIIQQAVNATSEDASGTVQYLQANRVDEHGFIQLGEGNFSTDSTVELPSHTWINGMGQSATVVSRQTTASPVFENMWNNYTLEVRLTNLRTYQGSYGLNYTMTSSTQPAGETYGYWLIVENVRVSLPGIGSVKLKTTTGNGNTITKFYNFGGSARRIYIDRVFDSEFINCNFGGMDLQNIATLHFTNIYVAGAFNPNIKIYGGTDAYPNHGNIFTNVRSDNAAGISLDYRGYSEYDVWTGCEIGQLSDGAADNTYPAIRFQTNVHHITITGSLIGNFNHSGRAAGSFSSLVEEWAGSHNNTITANTWGLDSYDGAHMLNVSDPSVSNFENRKITYSALCTAALDAGAVRYFAPFGQMGASATEATRTMYWYRAGWIGNFRHRLHTVPGAGKAFELWVHWNNNDYLLTNITGAVGYGENSTHIEIAPASTGTPFTMRTNPLNNPAAPIWSFEWDFYPYLEDIIQNGHG